MEHYSVLQNEQTQKGNGERNVVEPRSTNFYRNLIKLRVKCNRIVLLVVQKNINRICERGHFVCLFIRFPYWVILSTEKKEDKCAGLFPLLYPQKSLQQFSWYFLSQRWYLMTKTRNRFYGS